MEEDIKRLTDSIRNWETVSQSAAALITGFAKAARDKADDPQQIRDLADAADKSVSTLVESMKAGTPAAAEPVVTENPVTGAPVEPAPVAAADLPPADAPTS